MGIELTGKIISRLAFHKIIITQYCTHGHEIIMWRYLRRTDDYLKGKQAGDWLKSLGPYQVSSVLIHLSLKCCLFPKFPPTIFHLPNVPLQVQEKMFVAAEKKGSNSTSYYNVCYFYSMHLTCRWYLHESLTADMCQKHFHICAEPEWCWLTAVWEHSLTRVGLWSCVRVKEKNKKQHSAASKQVNQWENVEGRSWTWMCI